MKNTDKSPEVELKKVERINPNEGQLQLSPFTINENYRKKWNVSNNDFVVLTRDGELVRDTLYRVGGLNTPKLNKDRYFMLIKHVEAHYSKEIMRMAKSKDSRHLEGRWVIIDRNGNEKVEFDAYQYGTIIKNSCIYSTNSKFFNIETGKYYGLAASSIESEKYLILDNRYEFENDENTLGVMKINKADGTWEMID